MDVLEWAGRFFREHPGNEHLSTSSLRYVGNHCYLKYYKDQEVATIVTYRGTRLLLAHDPNMVLEEHEYDRHYGRVYWPFWSEAQTWHRQQFPTRPQIVWVHFRPGDNFMTVEDSMIVDTMRDRFVTDIKWAWENRELSRRWHFRYHVRRLVSRYFEFLEQVDHEPISDELRSMCDALNACTASTPENRRWWSSLAAKAGAKSREANKEDRIRRKAEAQERAKVTEEFRAWLPEQPFYASWELTYPRLIAFPMLKDKPEVAEFQRVIPNLSYLASNWVPGVHGRYNTFISVTTDIGADETDYVLRILSRGWWCSATLKITPESIDGLIETLGGGVPQMSELEFPDDYKFETLSFNNLVWTLNILAPRYARGARTLSPLNQAYLLRQLRLVKKQFEAMPEKAD